jgi:hypothetical protein
MSLHINFKLGILLCIMDCSKACGCAFRQFYLQEAGNYNMPDPTIRIGQYCVAPYEEEWHRACITAVHNCFEVQVRLQIEVVL